MLVLGARAQTEKQKIVLRAGRGCNAPAVGATFKIKVLTVKLLEIHPAVLSLRCSATTLSKN